MKTPFWHRVLSFFSSFSLLLQTLTPFFYSVPVYVRAQESLKSDISYSISNKDFKIKLNNSDAGITTGQLEYQLSYKNDSSQNPDQVEVAQGKTDLSGTNFEKSIDAATCSTNGTCVVHQAPRGILKMKVSGWTDVKWFSISGETVTVVNEKFDGVLDSITDEENNWLLKGDAPAPTVTPTPFPTAEPTVAPSVTPVASPTVEPTVTVTPTGSVLGSTGDEVVQATIVQTGSQAYVDPSIWTDKADYAPTEKVIVSGKNFTPGYIYTIVITSNDAPAITATGSVTAAQDGTFTYEYQLDGNYRPNYLVQVKDLGGVVVASVTFTDADTWPNCSFGCQANDVTITKLWLGDSIGTPIPNTCTPGQTIPVYVWVNFANNQNSSRYAVMLLGKLYQNGVEVPDHNYYTTGGKCVLPSITKNDNQNVNIDNFSWTCGQEVKLTNLVVSWSPSTETCSDTKTCNARGTSKCWSSSDQVINAPLISNFTTGDVCQGTATSFIDITTGGIKPYTYNWDFGDQSSHSFIANPTHTYASSGSFVVTDTVNDASSPPQSSFSTKTVNVWANPTAEFTFRPQSCPSTSIAFTNQSTGGSGYVWNFGDGNTSTDTDPTHIYTSPGTYTVTLTTTNGHSCVKSISHNVTIEPCSGTLIVNKTTIPANDTTQFSISVSGPGVTTPSRTTLATNHSESFTVTGGTYSVTESPSDGWSEDVSNCQNVEVLAGQTKSCTITNTKLPTLTVNKICNPVGDTGKFNLMIDGENRKADATCGGSTGPVVVSVGPHTVSETQGTGTNLSNYTSVIGNECAVNGTVLLAAGDNKTCDINNTLKRGSITVKKVIVGGTGSFNFTGDVAGTISANNGTITSSSLLPGIYSATEETVPGWDLTNITCDDTTIGGTASTGDLVLRKATFNVEAGENVTCTFTNIKKGHLVVQKTTLPSGDTTSFVINTTSSNGGVITGGSAGSVTDASDQDYEVTPGTYSVTETVPTGWDKTGDTCQNVAVAAGETKTCLLTNTKRGTVVVKKVATGGNDTFHYNASTTNGANLPTSFDITTINGAGEMIYNNIKPGDYTVNEVNLNSGWRQTSVVCDGRNSNNFTVEPGETVTCVFSNLGEGKIIINKTAIGGNGTFSYNVSGTSPSTPSFTTNSGTGTSGDIIVTSGSGYSVSEQDPGIGWMAGTPNCHNAAGLAVNPSSFDVDPGQTITCSFINTKKANIVIVKNTEGGDDTFPFTTTGGLGSGAFDLTTVSGTTSQSFTNIAPGTYGVSEGTLPAGWSLKSATCDNTNNPSSITVNAGTTVTCTFTNTKLPTLTINKVCNPADDTGLFNLRIDGSVKSGNVPCGGTTGPVTIDVGPHTVSETYGTNTDSSFYQLPAFGNACTSDGSVTLAAGENKTCTITNTRKLGSLTVTKVANWNGVVMNGDQKFTICITGPSHDVPDCQDAPYNGGNLTWTNLYPGSYIVTENNPGGEWDVVITGSPATVPANGGNATATVTNTRKHGNLTVTKTVNWNGVTPDTTKTFQICINGPTGGYMDNCKTIGSSGGNITWTDLIPGNYAVTETDPGSEWNVTVPASTIIVPVTGGTGTATVTNARKLGGLNVTKTVDWNGVTEDTTQTFDICIQGPSYPTTPNCKNIGYQGGNLDWSNLVPGDYIVTEPGVGNEWTVAITGSPVTVPVNGTAGSATVTNTRKHGSLTVTKVVEWNGVTPEQSKKFNICIQGPSYPTTANCKDVVYNGGNLSWTNLIPGDYVLTETNPGSNWSVVITNSLVNVPNDGGAGTATITNSIQQGKLIVIKHVSNTHGGSLVASNFTMNVTGTNVSQSSFPGDEKGTTVMLDPGAYSVDEASDLHYSKYVGTTCNGTIASGETKTCTITNEDKQGILIITKRVINDDGGTKKASDFTIVVTGGNVLPRNTFPGNVEGTRVTVDAGSYNVDELDALGYTKTIGEGCRGTMGVGSIIYCTITNNDNPKPLLTLSKFNTTWPNDTSAGSDVQYTLTLKVEQNNAYGVVVTDLPPSGFKPVGNCDVYKNNIKVATYACSDMYHSPGKWSLGDAKAGDVFKMVYSAAIDGGQKPGLYKDLAWAFGCANTSENCSINTGLLATAVDSGTVDPGTFNGVDSFVGTKVNINQNQQDSPSVNVKKEEQGQVLGASTSLPSTGTPAIMIIISGLFTMLGLFFLGFGLYKKGALRYARKLSIFVLAFAAFLMFSAGAEAASPDLYVRLVQPKSPTRVNDFTLGYVTLDLMASSNITVQCYITKPSKAEEPMGGAITVAPGGNSGVCPLTTDMVSDNGTYTFRANAQSSSGSVWSETISVDYNTSGPGTPSSYGKDKISNCEYKIHFKTADDGQTSKVEIYRSDSTSFNADGGTRITTVNIGPNQDGSFNDVVPDCNKTYYYVIRAFDSAGNGSGTIGDSVTVTTSSTTSTTTTTGGALPVANVTLAAGPAEGAVLGVNEEVQSTGSAASEGRGSVLSVETRKSGNPAMEAWKWITTHKKISLGTLVLLSILIFGIINYAKKKKTEIDQTTGQSKI